MHTVVSVFIDRRVKIAGTQGYEKLGEVEFRAVSVGAESGFPRGVKEQSLAE